MQSIFRLPWCSDPIAPKMSEKAALEKMRPTPTVEIPVFNKLKRKRTDGDERGSPQRGQELKKPRPEDVSSQLQSSNVSRLPAKTEQIFTQVPEVDPTSADSVDSRDLQAACSDKKYAQPVSPLSDVHEPIQREQVSAAMEPTSDALMSDAQDANGLSPLQQVIENEFNMQILMKHNELRLIEQELAKCQVALEQLRRCELRPFPGNDGPTQAVSSGTGPSILPQPGYTRPSHPAPHGVTDGPYSRHYKQWLLQDPQFDPMSIQALQMEAAGRPTRNSGSARKSLSSRSFVFPGRPGDNMQSIPNYPAVAPKDKNSPLILRRSTDGQLVKLICNNCLRGNFSSIQGFLNHCRIAHKVDYKSHDAAAIDCGRTLDENEAANLPVETPNPTPAPKASVGRPPVATAPSSSTAHRNSVHPFNTAAGANITLSSVQQSDSTLRRPIQSLSSAAQSDHGSPLTPSAQVPRLSAQFAKHQVGGDLHQAIANARQKVDLGFDHELPSPDISLPNSPLGGAAGSRVVVGGKPGPAVLARPPSRKGFRQPTQQRPRPSPLVPASTTSVKQEHEIPESPQDSSFVNLSPHTADSNPGLVSDNEDDDHGSASEEEAPQAAPAMRRSLPVGVPNCADNMDIDVAVEDDEIDQDGVIIRRSSMFAEDERAMRGGAGSPSRKLGEMPKGGA